MQLKWYAVYTKPHWEKKVADLLTRENIENYCPLNMTVRQWSDRKKKIYEPLFTSYVFVRAHEKQHIEIKSVSGVINLVYWLNKPAVIRDGEIATIKEFLNEYQCVQLKKTAVNLNDTVRILQGPLMEYEGSVVEIRSNTVKVVLPSLGYMMTAEVQKTNVNVIKVNHASSVLPNLAPGKLAKRC